MSFIHRGDGVWYAGREQKQPDPQMAEGGGDSTRRSEKLWAEQLDRCQHLGWVACGSRCAGEGPRVLRQLMTYLWPY